MVRTRQTRVTPKQAKSLSLLPFAETDKDQDWQKEEREDEDKDKDKEEEKEEEQEEEKEEEKKEQKQKQEKLVNKKSNEKNIKEFAVSICRKQTALKTSSTAKNMSDFLKLDMKFALEQLEKKHFSPSFLAPHSSVPFNGVFYKNACETFAKKEKVKTKKKERGKGVCMTEDLEQN
jgi:hypothetical protein